MISWAWLILAFIVGAFCGLIIMAMCAIGKISEQETFHIIPHESSGDDEIITGGKG